MNFLEKLKSLIVDEDGDIDMYGLELENWPNALDDEGDEESADLENWGITSLNPNHMNMWMGGDWQNPVYVAIAQSPNSDELRCIYTNMKFDLKGVPDLSDKEIKKILGVN